MRKKIAVFIWIMLLSIPLTGCWDIKYLDELAIVTAVGIDSSKDDEINVTVQVVNPTQVSTGGSKGGGGGGNSPVTAYSETGRTVLEAVRKINNISSRRLYFSHNQVLVIGEDLAREGISRLFEFMERDPEVRTDFYLVIAKDAKASDVLNVTTPIEKIPGNKIHDSVENVEERLGTAYGVTIKEIIEDIMSEKKEITAASIEIDGSMKKGGTNKNVEQINPQTSMKINGIAVFKDEKLVEFFTLEESRGAAWILDRITNTVINVPCSKQGKMVIEVIHSSTNLKAKFQQGEPSIAVRIEQEANIGENICPEMALSDEESIHQIEKGTEQQIKTEITDALKKAQNMKTDIFGFGETVYKANPHYWDKNKNSWDDIFSNIRVQIEVDTKIRREGLRNKSYFRKIDTK